MQLHYTTSELFNLLRKEHNFPSTIEIFLDGEKLDPHSSVTRDQMKLFLVYTTNKNNKIVMIKDLRSRTGLSLKDSKLLSERLVNMELHDFVETLREECFSVDYKMDTGCKFDFSFDDAEKQILADDLQSI